jgi:hypothetical protein
MLLLNFKYAVSVTYCIVINLIDSVLSIILFSIHFYVIKSKRQVKFHGEIFLLSTVL